MRLRVCEWPGEGRPVVILHGFLEQGYAWSGVATRLDRQVVAPDHRGHGRSGHVGAGGFYHFWDYVADVDALVEHLGGPVDLVGHSMGGTIAALFAGTRPDSVRRLVLVEGLGPPDMSTSGVVARARQFLDAMRSPPLHKPLESLEDGVRRLRRFNPGIDEAAAVRLVARLTDDVGDTGGRTWAWDPLHRARSPVPFQASLFKRFLERIEAPVLLVDGETSTFRLPDREQRQQCLAQVERVVIPAAGHLVHHDAPDALAHVIERHLDG